MAVACLINASCVWQKNEVTMRVRLVGQVPFYGRVGNPPEQGERGRISCFFSVVKGDKRRTLQPPPFFRRVGNP